MNVPFILFVCLGLCVLGIPIAGAFFNAKVGGSARSAPWMRRVRAFQNEAENAGWRIHAIPYTEGSKPMMIDLRGVLSIVSIVGALGFCGGLALGFYGTRTHIVSGLIVAVSSWVVSLCCYWLKARIVKLDWDVAPARCVDREVKKVRAPAVGGGWTWVWRIVCEYEYLGNSLPRHAGDLLEEFCLRGGYSEVFGRENLSRRTMHAPSGPEESASDRVDGSGNQGRTHSLTHACLNTLLANKWMATNRRNAPPFDAGREFQAPHALHYRCRRRLLV